LYLVVHLVVPGGLGAGDVKLALGVGGLTGAFGSDVWLLAALGAPVLTAVLAVAVAVRDRTASVPHGPSMCLASLAAAALVVF
ncbi:MAG: prepilin peptidase, partial [Mycolicibacterium aromaticivorans]|nr:prepilin peptidase [Mycolicibacterium aromaticivorans]